MALVVCRTGDWFGAGPAHRALHFAAPVLICSDPLLRGCQQPQSCGQEQTLWMSELDLVLAELRGLRQELGELTQRVAALERSGGGGSRGFSAPASPVTVNYSFSSPLVPYAGGSGIGSSPTAELQAPVPVASPAEEAVPEDQTEERFRLEVASGVGRFLPAPYRAIIEEVVAESGCTFRLGSTLSAETLLAGGTIRCSSSIHLLPFAAWSSHTVIVATVFLLAFPRFGKPKPLFDQQA